MDGQVWSIWKRANLMRIKQAAAMRKDVGHSSLLAVSCDAAAGSHPPPTHCAIWMIQSRP